MRRGLSPVASALIGALTAAVVLTVVPASAGNGDPLILGETNRAGRITKVITKKGLLIRARLADTPALRLEVESGAPFTVNSSARVDGLNADLLDGKNASAFLGVGDTAADSAQLEGRAANGLVRVAFSSTVVEAEGESGENLAGITVNITAPEAGFLIMSASIDTDVVGTSDFDDVICLVAVDDSVVSGSARFSELDDLFAFNAEEDCGTDAGLAVGAGTHEVIFLVSDLLGNVAYTEGTLWVLWTPFGADGSTPSLEALPDSRSRGEVSTSDFLSDWRRERLTEGQRGS